MRLIRSLVLSVCIALIGTSAYAAPAEVERALPGAAQVGAARYQVLALAIFDAELWAGQGAFSWERPFALSLTYRRAITAQSLTNRTLTEIARRGGGTRASLQPLGTRLRQCFANVSAGDRITGVSTGANTARFFYNGRQQCEIEWPGFRRTFFGIWLDGRSGNERQFTLRLLGEE